VQLITLARNLALAKAGSSMAAKMAMMAMTTSSSINVKPSASDVRVEKVSFFMAAGSRGYKSALQLFQNIQN
jgi:hypothetical protein